MTFNKSIKDIILSKLVKPGEQSVGVEIESIIYTKEEKRLPVNSKKGLSAINILQSMNNLIDKNGDYSLEPGGQIEWSSKPYKNLNDLEKAIKVQNDKFYKILSENDFRLIALGLSTISGGVSRILKTRSAEATPFCRSTVTLLNNRIGPNTLNRIKINLIKSSELIVW